MARDGSYCIVPAMHCTYAVTWQESDDALHSGKLELRASGLSLEGSGNGSGVATLLVPYGEVLRMRVAPSHERLDGRSTLVLDRRGKGLLRIASVAQPGIISEVAEQLAGFSLARAWA